VALIELHGIGKTYQSGGGEFVALQPTDVSVDEGEFAAVMGPSGSGKSTLLSILGALNAPSVGRLVVDGIDVYDLGGERLADFRHEYIGFVFQQFQLVPYLTALENTMLPLAIAQGKPAAKRAAATAVLERVGLGAKLHSLPSELSGGEQERVAIARATINRPPILLADEPTGALDTATGDEIMALFGELNAEGQTVLMVTHDTESARHARRIIAIRDGRVC
jgi:putative ABC transport system ATP-binding protein